MKPNTTTFMKKVTAAKNIGTFLNENKDVFRENECMFHEVLMKYCDERKLVAEHVIKASQIERTYGHQLFNGTRNPSRDKVIQLGIGMQLDLEELQQLLRAAKKSALYPKIKRDAVIIFAIHRKLNMMELQELLENLKLPILGQERGA